MESIIKNYLDGNFNSDEQKKLLDWLREDSNLKKFQTQKENWQQNILKNEMPEMSQKSWQLLQSGLYEKTHLELLRSKRYLKILKYAAVVVMLISLSGFGLFYLTIKNQNQELVYSTVVAEPGQISKVVLADQTEIWLNSGSSLKYNNQFASTNRDVELIGEAYFDVAKNPDLPLIVSGSPVQVKVLGTKFNVTAYPLDKTFSVVLEEGKVELNSSQYKNLKRNLEPGEMAVFDKENRKISIQMVNTELYTDWKDGMINIYNLPLEEVVQKLSKRYNQKFEVDKGLKQLHYTFTIKNEPLSEILKMMETITPIRAEQNMETIRLKYYTDK
ncbi:MAG: FecR domain-containing protein [Bacteroidales bacterium]|nr:FecR domain-containing protein [Bacteroidales bacterium]